MSFKQNGSRQWQNKGKTFQNNQSNQPAKYVGAPYNFVSFYDQVVPVKEERMTVHDRIEEDLLSGEISYQITAKTPLFIDDGTDQHNFMRDERGNYSIPGSTMRGMIRSHVQILGLSGMDQDIDDYQLMYRNVAAGAEKKRYNKVLGADQVSVQPGKKPIGVLTNVSAGYIKNVNGKYVICKTKKESITAKLKVMNYYVLSERMLADDAKSGYKKYPFFKPNGKNKEVLQHIISRGFRKETQGKWVHYKGVQNNDYVPGWYPVSYEISNLKNVVYVGAPGAAGKEQGTLIATGKMMEKKALYIIPEIDETKPVIEIPDKDVRSFQIDFENKKNTLAQYKNVEFFNLPEDENPKPVFYIELDGRLYFGFTPRLRLFYDNTLKTGLKQKKAEYDYAKSIFGMVGEKKQFKSKVSFSDAVAQESVQGELNEEKRILAEPKPTSYLDYIEQEDGSAKTYNSSDFRLRGVKQYWLRKNIVPGSSDIKNEKVASTLRPLPEGSTFAGKVRFTNLTRDELGLLVWAIYLEENSWVNIGKGKAYGFGAAKISNVQVNVIDPVKAYSLDSNFDLSPFKEVSVEKAIEDYKSEIQRIINRSIDDLKHIQEFFMMKNSEMVPDPNAIRYMSIDAREYQSRTKALPSVSEILETKGDKNAAQISNAAPSGNQQLKAGKYQGSIKEIANNKSGKADQVVVLIGKSHLERIRINKFKALSITANNVQEKIHVGDQISFELSFNSEGQKEYKNMKVN